MRIAAQTRHSFSGRSGFSAQLFAHPEHLRILRPLIVLWVLSNGSSRLPPKALDTPNHCDVIKDKSTALAYQLRCLSPLLLVVGQDLRKFNIFACRAGNHVGNPHIAVQATRNSPTQESRVSPSHYRSAYGKRLIRCVSPTKSVGIENAVGD